MKILILAIFSFLSIPSFADCRKLLAEGQDCPENLDLMICEKPDIHTGVFIVSGEAEFFIDFKTTFCGTSRVADQIYCNYEETYPGRSQYSSGHLLRAVLYPRDINPIPSWDLSGSFILTLANGKTCHYKVQ